MGHSEMGLAVAGLKGDDLKKLRQKLADGDWASFPPAERTAFPFGVKLSREPGKVTEKDIRALTETFGRHRAVDMIFYVAWGNYMTRVADAFQLPLEREDPFIPRAKEPAKDGTMK
jgi:hypothetical protein